MFPAAEPQEPASERKVHAALSRLPSGWRVFHGVSWQSVSDGRQGDGEADFVVLHPQRGILVLEVKGGGISVDRGRWWSTDRSGDQHEIKNPYVQATRSKHALGNHLRSLGISDVKAGHGVWFPDLTGVGGLGPAAPREITMDRLSLADPTTALDQVFAHWELRAPMSSSSVASVTQHLAPTTTFKPLMRDLVAEVNQAIEALTNQQLGVLRGIKRNRRALVYGGAGTGKTVLAVAQARSLARDGFKTLLTCFNTPLGHRLEAELADEPNITATSFHALCTFHARRAGFDVPRDPGPSWWETELPAILPEAAEQNGVAFDAIVVDEGQDFRPAWFSALSLLLRDDTAAPTYVFADAKQAIYVEGWESPFEAAEFDLETNCRNSGAIAKVVGAVYGDAMQVLHPAGPDVEKVPVPDEQRALKEVIKAVGRLLTVEHLTKIQLAALSPEKAFVQALRNCGKPHRFGPIDQADTITAETVHRFKGLESDGVVLHVPSLTSARARALAYIGASRARAHLTLVGPPEILEQLDP